MALVDIRNTASRRISSKLVSIFFGLAILCLPYDAVRYLPSNYRPLALVPLALVAFFCIKEMARVRLGGAAGFLAAFSGFAFVVTFVNQKIFGVAGSWLDCLATIAIGLFVFVVCFCCFKLIYAGKDYHGYLLWFADLVSKAFVIPIVVGLIQVACMYHLLPNVVASSLASVFGTVQVGRIAMTSSEASWAACLMVFAAPLIYISYMNSKRATDLFEFVALLILFVLNASAQGLATLGVGLVIFAFLLSYARGNLFELLKKAIPIAILVVLMLAVLPLLVQVVPVPSYVRARFINLTSIAQLIHGDGSSFIRICHPILSLKMWTDSPIFGFGGGSFTVLYPDYLANSFPWAIDGRFSEVLTYYRGLAEPSPLNLYARILCEFGLIGFLLYAGFLLMCLTRVKRFIQLGRNEQIPLFMWVGILLAIPIQFQSYCYVPVLMGLAFVSAVPLSDEHANKV